MSCLDSKFFFLSDILVNLSYNVWMFSDIHARHILCLSNRDETSISNNSILFVRVLLKTFDPLCHNKNNSVERLYASCFLVSFLQFFPSKCSHMYMLANHLMDKAEKADGNAFEIAHTQTHTKICRKKERKKKKRDFNLV